MIDGELEEAQIW